MNAQGLKIEQAVTLGQNIADTTAAASFRVVKSGLGETAPLGEVSKFLSSRYRPSKRQPDIFVEKNKYRINTLGETQEIKPKTVFKSKKKSIFVR